jgi:hypothetical protein
MRIITLIILIGVFLASADAKMTLKKLKLANFNKEGPFIFVTKMHIGAGHGQVDVTYR